jgi:protein-L-isoaspartate O-methyltransferase
MKKVLNYLPSFLKEKISNYYIGYRLLTKPDFFLYEMGYTKSYHNQTPMDKNGEFLPWMNYAIIDFLNKRLTKNMTFFEYGSGYSSIYYSKKVKDVTSIEYDIEWKNKVQNLFKKYNLDNVKVHFQAINENYPKTIKTINPEKKYDIVLVDGRMRVECAIEAISSLSENGVLILDDSSRDKYQEIFSFYNKNNFKHITFSGIKPSG